MSLYYEAAAILTTTHKGGGSIKSLVHGAKTHKSDPKTLFALSTQAAKWSEVLSEVIEKSGILKSEKQLTPTMALVLSHDLLLSKRGIALPQTHGLTVTVTKYKARLSAELTKARIRRGCASLDQLRERIEDPDGTANDNDPEFTTSSVRYPRWVRINQLRSTLEQQLSTTFADYVRADSVKGVTDSRPRGSPKPIYVDEHILNLVAIQPNTGIATSKAYKDGQLIFQDKASCFPAYLLDPTTLDGDIIDACAAPGNKTTHLAALLSQREYNHEQKRASVIACEKDAARSLTLQKMVKLASGDKTIRIRSKQDFMKLDPHDATFADVTALLLDPSCSGSGIVGRDEASVTVHLPQTSSVDSTATNSKKRKRGSDKKPVSVPVTPSEEAVDEETPVEEADATKLQARLTSLAAFQLRIVQHAMAFPSAQRITYSTCSVHAIENEHVVIKALRSQTARERGWRVMRREDQVDGMRRWHVRGSLEACRSTVDDQDGNDDGVDVQEVAEACIRCDKGSEDGTMGFFVAGFVRGAPVQSTNGTDVGQTVDIGADNLASEAEEDDDSEEEEWNGF